MKIKAKQLHENATLPEYATDGASAIDFKTIESGEVPAHGSRVFDTGLAIEVPQGFVLLLFSRSGHGFKNGLRLANAVGVIDSDYRGCLKIKIHNDSHTPFSFEPGDRIAQGIVMFAPHLELEWASELGTTERGAGGMGSTGA